MKIRLPAEVKELIEHAAQAAGRSLNAEIVVRLQSTFEEMPDEQRQVIAKMIDESVEKAMRAAVLSHAEKNPPSPNIGIGQIASKKAAKKS